MLFVVIRKCHYCVRYVIQSNKIAATKCVPGCSLLGSPTHMTLSRLSFLNTLPQLTGMIPRPAVLPSDLNFLSPPGLLSHLPALMAGTFPVDGTVSGGLSRASRPAARPHIVTECASLARCIATRPSLKIAGVLIAITSNKE